jgi:hypothetical protein
VSATTTQQARLAALAVLTKVSALIRPAMDADLVIRAVSHGIDVRLHSECPDDARELAEVMHLTAEPPLAVQGYDYHVWSGTWDKHQIRISVLVPIEVQQ